MSGTSWSILIFGSGSGWGSGLGVGVGTGMGASGGCANSNDCCFRRILSFNSFIFVSLSVVLDDPPSEEVLIINDGDDCATDGCCLWVLFHVLNVGLTPPFKQPYGTLSLTTYFAFGGVNIIGGSFVGIGV